MSEAVSINEFSRLSGSARDSIAAWFRLENLAPADTAGKHRKYDKGKGLEIIRRHAEPSRHRAQQNRDANIDPETGLTWAQKKLKEEAQALERENRIAERLENKTYIDAVECYETLSQLCRKLDQIPSKARSMFGLTAAVEKGLQQLIDDAREAAAKQIETGNPPQSPSRDNQTAEAA